MSSSNAGNVVPLASAAPMTTTTPPPPPMPNPMWWGGAPPGCAPGGGSGLIDCYWGVQAATAFISAIMIDAINNNPAVTQAIIAAIEASGSALPLIGVTNGADAQAGQVGEFVFAQIAVNFTAASQSQTITAAILQPGDWDFWAEAYCSTGLTSLNYSLSPTPAGLTGQPQAFAYVTGTEALTLNTASCRMLNSVPTLMPYLILTNQVSAGPAAGTLQFYFFARRRR